MTTQPSSPSNPDSAAPGGTVLLADIASRICRRADRLFAWLVLIEWGVAIAGSLMAHSTALVLGQSQSTHLWMAIIIGGVVTGITLATVFGRPGKLSNGYLIAACQMVMCQLVILQFAGRTEAFFLVYVLLGLIAFYRNVQILIMATVVTVAGYAIFALVWPEWFGERFLAYSASVALEAALLSYSILRVLSEWRESAHHLTDLEQERHQAIEARVQRREAQLSLDRLREHEERTAAILERAHEAFVAIDERGKITDWNKQAEQLFGWSRQDALGRTLPETIIPPDMRDAHEKGLKRFLETGEGRIINRSIEVNALHRSGYEFPIELSVTPVKVGTTWTICAFLRDITERTQMIEDLALARDNAQEASLLKSQFVANMSHEIRTPMNGILGMSNILLKTALNSKQFECVSAIRSAGLSLLNIINGILDLSKIEAEKIELECVPFAPTELIEGVAELLVQPAKAKGLALVTFVSPEIPSELIGDRERLKQILTNLAGNAIKFSDHGLVVVRAVVDSLSEDNVTLALTVTDTGIGIAEDELKSLFQPFVQADGSISRKYGGTGLGLSISKGLVELMGGTIAVESEKGQGSTFSLKIPFVRGGQKPRSVNSRYAFDKVRVLIVNDEPYVTDVLVNYVVSWGLRSVCVENPEHALAVLLAAAEKGDPFPVAILDLREHAQDGSHRGVELGRTILEDDRLKATQLILVHDLDDLRNTKVAREAGFQALIARPIKQAQLLEALAEIATQRTVRRMEAGKITREFALRAQKIPAKRHEVVLIADDNPINRQVLEFHLEELGFGSHAVNNGSEAIEAIAKTNYALVFLDCQMPELDGLEATRIIRKSEAGGSRHVPIVAVTAHAMKGDRDNCLAAGMDDYISKPIDEHDLRTVLERWVPGGTGSLEEQSLVPEEKEADPSAPMDSPVPEGDSSSVDDGGQDDPQPMIDRLLYIYGKEKADRLLDVFVSDCSSALERLQEAVSMKNVREVTRETHYMKGACEMMQATTMTQQCLQIEQSVPQDGWEQITCACQRLAQALDVIRSRIDTSTTEQP